MKNRLFYGDNLAVLRGRDADGKPLIPDESIDLIYLDPPFNSAATYNVLFRAPDGKMSDSQLEAFEDSWHWGDAAAAAYEDVITQGVYTDASVLLRGIVTALGKNDMTAYLAMMAVRLIELHRVLKPTGSLYLHCDPTASHYLKILLDGVFGAENFRNEIIWQRTTAKSLMSVRLPSNHDVILFYQKSDNAFWNPDSIFQAYDENNLPDKTEKKYSYRDADGRRYTLGDLLNPNPDRPNLTYEFLGMTRVWRWTRARMEEAYQKGLVVQPRPGAVPRFKRYLDEQRGIPLGDVWTDIFPLNSQAQERLGYPTQKPLALLERIIKASSRPDDVILDPFCGCGTTVHAAEKLGRRWVGIDVTHLAISLVERRLKDAFPNIAFDVLGTPRDLSAARDLAARDKHQFQWWAVSLLDAVPQGGKKKGADRGIDGIRWVRTGPRDGDLDRVIVSVKGGENFSVRDVRDLAGTVQREGALGGVLITLADPTRDMLREAASHGYASTGLGQFRKIMVKTIAELMAGVHDEAERLPPIGRGEGFRAAPRERSSRPSQAGLFE
ncbi:MAG: restriction endonuclease [Roseomonas sp.]|nr:restriction endonuclease [Roseomonas sp.]